MTASVARPGSPSSQPSAHDSATSTNSPAAVASQASPTRRRQPSPSATDAPSNGSSSLYALGIQAQDIASEIALAAELLATDDPGAELTAVALIEQYLSAQQHTAGLIENKADNICRYIDHLKAVASFREEQSKRLKELAVKDNQRVEKLQAYMMRVLTTLYPEKTEFSLPTHELRSRKSTAIVIENESEIPDEYLRSNTTYSPDKASIKEALRSGTSVPGARLEERRSWSIK